MVLASNSKIKKEKKMNNTKQEYDGSTRTTVFTKKLKSVESVDSALARVETRFNYLRDERLSLKEQLRTVSDSEERISLVDKDVAYMNEQKSLVAHRDGLVEKRQELVSLKAEEVNNYSPEEVTW